MVLGFGTALANDDRMRRTVRIIGLGICTYLGLGCSGESSSEVQVPTIVPAEACLSTCQYAIESCPDFLSSDLAFYRANFRPACLLESKVDALELCVERCELVLNRMPEDLREMASGYLDCGAKISAKACNDEQKSTAFNECASRICSSPSCFESLHEFIKGFGNQILSNEADGRGACQSGRNAFQRLECESQELLDQKGALVSCFSQCCQPGPCQKPSVGLRCDSIDGKTACKCIDGKGKGRELNLVSCDLDVVEPFSLCGF